MEAMNLTNKYSEILLLFASTFLLVFIIFKVLEWRKLPPGPYGLPILGYFPFLKHKPQEVFVELGKKYGKMFCFNIFIYPCLVINDWTVAQKILKHPATFARPNNFTQMLPGNGGFISEEGEEWMKRRKYSMTALKTLGIGRGKWEILMQEEVADFIKEIKTWRGQAKDFLQFLELSWSNNIISLFFSRELSSKKNKESCKIIQNAVDILTSFSLSSVVANAPLFILKILRKAKLANVDKLFDAIETYEVLIKKEINKSLTSMENGEKESTFINFYVDEIKKENYDKKELDQQILRLCGDITSLYIGAYDTTKASLQWLLLLIASHPNVQHKIHEEIDNIFGNNHSIYWEDRNSLPYTMATITEALRWITTLPLFPPRRTLDTIKFENYVIPKGTIILTNGWRIMRDPMYYQHPDNFKPERFLSNNSNKQHEKLESFFPFSVGKRNCPGEQIAMMSLFLYFTAIMQKFHLVCPDGKTSAILEDNASEIVRHAVRQELRFIER